jgi:hypothetical protein
MLYHPTTSVPTTPQQWAEARSLGDSLNINRLESFAAGCRNMSGTLQTAGRSNESAFWMKTGAKVAECVADIQNGSRGNVMIGIFNDYMRARLFDLKCAVDDDNNLPGAKPDTTGWQTGRRVLSKGIGAA